MPPKTQRLTRQDLDEALAQLRRDLLADIRALVSIPFDDEPVSDEERQAVQEALDHPGPNIPHADVLREFGL